MSAGIWIISNPDDKTIPRWMRMAFVDTNDDVYIPAAVSGSEDSAAYSAMFDGEPAIANDGHVYLRTSWVAKEFPAEADLCRLIERRAREHAKAEGGIS